MLCSKFLIATFICVVGAHVGVPEGAGDGWSVGNAEGNAVPISSAFFRNLLVAEAIALKVGVCDGSLVGTTVAIRLVNFEMADDSALELGLCVGVNVGMDVGWSVGLFDGMTVGTSVGKNVGILVLSWSAEDGCNVGTPDGWTVGASVGSVEGWAVGAEGSKDGVHVGGPNDKGWWVGGGEGAVEGISAACINLEIAFLSSLALGLCVGVSVGMDVGWSVGLFDGTRVGGSVGMNVGTLDLSWLADVGCSVGFMDGSAVGTSVGLYDGWSVGTEGLMLGVYVGIVDTPTEEAEEVELMAEEEEEDEVPRVLVGTCVGVRDGMDVGVSVGT